MDELARRYLGLALRLDRRQPGIVEAYAGPPELQEAVDGEHRESVTELHDEAVRLRGEAEAVQTTNPDERRRSAWLATQASALAAAARVVAGDEIALTDLVESLCDVSAERDPDPELLGAHRLLDAALPGGASLRARLAAHRESTVIPADHVPAAAESLAALLRQRAREDLDIPDVEGLVFEPLQASGEAWHVRPDAEPGMRTRLAVNLAVPWSLDQLIRSVATQAYPGGHAARAVREASAVDRGVDELLIWCRPAPEATIADGIGAVGREVLVGDFELAGELRRIGRELGLRWEVERDLEVSRARERLTSAVANAALLLHHDGLPAPEVRAYLAEIALLEPDAVERVFAILEHPLRRVEPFARAQAPRLVRAWLEGAGQTDGLRRLMADQLTPGALRAEVGIAA